ncbi:hypothetical protein [Tateyamaria sp. syn59]|uniref:hypothetical protein n=1 Tax=Tateyamaria sp. syn59 TaxID=2576942 RepID=UPI001CB8F07E|nr:hypothetical protein [Tateyamaria sp. syn59]
MDDYENDCRIVDSDFSTATDTNDTAQSDSTLANAENVWNNILVFPAKDAAEPAPASTHVEVSRATDGFDVDDDLWARDVFLVCATASTAPVTLQALSERMKSLTVSDDFDHAFQLATCCDGADVLLALDLDAAEDIKDVFIRLAELRRSNRPLAVLTMSRSFTRTCVTHRENSDFSDASVRLPASEYEMSMALHFAVTNAFLRTSCDDDQK